MTGPTASAVNSNILRRAWFPSGVDAVLRGSVRLMRLFINVRATAANMIEGAPLINNAMRLAGRYEGENVMAK